MLPLILILAAWGELHSDGPPALKGPPPKHFARKEALEELQGLLAQWQKERLDFSREQQLQTHAIAQLEHSRGQAADPAERVRGFSKVLDAREPPAPGTTRAGKGKVIELPSRDKLDVALDEAEAEAEAKREDCIRNRGKCEQVRQQREALEAANADFEAAIERNFEKRRAQIEAEATQIQAELDAAKRREANREAKKLGGSYDEEGEFRDDDLKAAPPPHHE